MLASNALQPSVKHQAATVEPEPRLGRHHGSVSQSPGSSLPRWGHAAFPQDAVRSPAKRDAADAAPVLLSLPALWLPGRELLTTVLAQSVQEARSAVSQGGTSLTACVNDTTAILEFVSLYYCLIYRPLSFIASSVYSLLLSIDLRG